MRKRLFAIVSLAPAALFACASPATSPEDVAHEDAELAPCCSTAPALVTWDASAKASFLQIDSDVSVSDSAQQVRGSTRATLPRCSGKWYWEVDIDDSLGSGRSAPMIGVGTAAETLSGDYIGGDANGWSYYPYDARKYNNAKAGGWSQYGEVGGVGDTIGVAMNLDAGTLEFFRNGRSLGVAFYNLPAGTPLYAMIGTSELNFAATARFAGSFKYAPPAGFQAYGGVAGTTWDPGARASFVSLAHGNFTASDSMQQVRGSTRATTSKSSGKWYWEVRLDDAGYGLSYPMIGVGTAQEALQGLYIGGDANGWSYYPADARKYFNAAAGGFWAYGTPDYRAGDVLGVALDADAGTLAFYQNGAALGTAFVNVPTKTALYPMVGTAELYFGATARFAAPFTYAPPAGYAPYDGNVASCQ